ncbi:hypothetical protein Zm00014a_006141 [Zea mays]|uniref:Uncharacterized protein n=1 Tax=Zea mays TaxID=4577 RepID=A0A3L6EEN8_MAIZE|nr:hypothetical protein Zm00014a_006141 [Zea mays]
MGAHCKLERPRKQGRGRMVSSCPKNYIRSFLFY